MAAMLVRRAIANHLVNFKDTPPPNMVVNS